mgnify:CR=1 FL=1
MLCDECMHLEDGRGCWSRPFLPGQVGHAEAVLLVEPVPDVHAVRSDYYGGNCASVAQLFYDDGDNWKREIEKAIIASLSVQETVTPVTLLLVEIPGADKSDKDIRLEELWRQFGDVPMNPETECIEEDFLH